MMTMVMQSPELGSGSRLGLLQRAQLEHLVAAADLPGRDPQPVADARHRHIVQRPRQRVRSDGGPGG